MTFSTRQRWQAAAIATGATPVIALLGRTLRWTVEGADHYDAVVRAGRQPILALWHGRILAATYHFRDRGIVAMASQNFDGEWITRIMSRFGYHLARGSTSRGGARALVRLRRELANGRPAAFTVDGPRGPARVAQPGAVWLAGATGQPIVPFHIEAERAWAASSWDRTQVPHPFSRIAVVLGEPLEVPGTAAPAIATGVAALEAALGRLEDRALELVGRAGAPRR